MKRRLISVFVLFFFINPGHLYATSIDKLDWAEEPPAIELKQNIKTCPAVKLPQDKVSVVLSYPGDVSRFKVIPDGIPEGSCDIHDWTYSGWCADRSKEIQKNEFHEVWMYSSCDLDKMPEQFRLIDWGRINFILNHKGEASWADVQAAIWKITNEKQGELSEAAKALLLRADTEGRGFVPGGGQVLAIICDPGGKRQPFLFEYEISKEEIFAAPPVAYAPPVVSSISPFAFLAAAPAGLLVLIDGGGGESPPDNPKPPPNPPPNPPVPEPAALVLVLLGGLVFFILRIIRQ